MRVNDLHDRFDFVADVEAGDPIAHVVPLGWRTSMCGKLIEDPQPVDVGVPCGRCLIKSGEWATRSADSSS